MACKDKSAQSVLQELRTLATWIVRDAVSSDQLDAYMTHLLNVQLVELHSCCRYEAMLLARKHQYLCAPEVAKHLLELASDLEKSKCEPPRVEVRNSRRPANDDKPPSSAPAAVQRPRQKTRWDENCSGWFPKAFAAISGGAITVALLSPDCGSSTLRLSAAAGCGLFSMLYAAEAVRLAWRKSHPLVQACDQ